MRNQIVYTNSNCKDAWDMFIQQNKKHTKMDLCFISDLNNFKSIDDKKIFLYEEYCIYRCRYRKRTTNFNW
jgi:hypothetical protein